MVISHGVLHLMPRRETDLQHMPIACFLTSLAEDRKAKAIGDEQGRAALSDSLNLASEASEELRNTPPALFE
jgi:hypothetical protein